jgi:uncharacterized paraquat-inducible protein A
MDYQTAKFATLVYYSAVKTYHSHIMYCPSCGAEYTIELKYCNRCGANLNIGLATQPEPVIVNITKPALVIGTTIVLLTLGGFGGLIGGSIGLAQVVHGNDPLIAMILFGMLTIMIVDIFLVRLLVKIVNTSLSGNTQPQPRRPNALANPPMIHPPQPAPGRLTQGVPSVTEGTTRFLEPAQTPSETRDRSTANKLER